MMQLGRSKKIALFSSLVLILALILNPALLLKSRVSAQAEGNPIYIPVIYKNWPPPPKARVNIPYFGNNDVIQSHFTEMAIFWFGNISPSENYADVRIGYNNSELVIYAAIFDRRLWYDTTPTIDDLTNWDALTLLLDTSSVSNPAPTSTAYKFIAQFSRSPEAAARTNYQAAYRGNGTGWVTQAISFSTISGWRGTETNDDTNDRGWAMTFRIPFSSLGLTGSSLQGKIHHMSLILHDRDSGSGGPLAPKYWPKDSDSTEPATWAHIHYGMPAYISPPASNQQTTVIRHKLNGAAVPDAAVGGTTGNLCPGDESFIWSTWGNLNFGKAADFNIQNQSDLADWPCFSKYYINYPLDSLPAGKVIVSATLTLYHWSNSGSLALAKPSYIHVMSAASNWTETSLTWNNAPLVRENFAAAWVPVQTGCTWPCTPRTWNVSRAVAQAYQEGIPLRLVFYSTDSDYHSGKFFTTSDTGDWNAAGRPKLEVVWGNP
jgi:hypothetical protein